MTNEITFDGVSFNKEPIQNKSLSEYKKYMASNPHLLGNDENKVEELYNLVNENNIKTTKQLPVVEHGSDNSGKPKKDKSFIPKGE